MRVALISPLLLFSARPACAQGPAAPSGNAAIPLGAFTVTGTRERAPLAETPVSISALAADALQQAAPLHPGQIMGQFPGVAVAVTNGEGHTTAIRQPFTTSPVYLFLEDGIPIRATGFFNHNALYEVNLPMAGGIEVVRGPGTALHGSDAIGGIVNVLSQAPRARPESSVLAEAGSFGVYRVLAGATTAVAEDGAIRADFNRTHNDGWRERTAYDRESVNLRWDQPLAAGATLKSILGWSRIDQETGANSPLPYQDYRWNPTRNNFAIAYRKVEALRLSVEHERPIADGLLTLTPYFRNNRMELNASFTLNSDPRIDKTENVSLGALLKWRRHLPALRRARVIAGLDADYSPGSRREDNLLVTRTGTGAGAVYRAYTVGPRIYDYRVTLRSISPYVHTEFSPTAALRLTAGLRGDALEYDFKNSLAADAIEASVLGATRFYGQIGGHTNRYARLSPKLGATYALSEHFHLYASSNHGFRAPSEGQLYRAGHDSTVGNALARARLALRLQPIKARQSELGLRGDLAGWSGHVVAYTLAKRDDLVSQRDPVTNLTTNVNAGETRHEGIEVGIGGPLPGHLRLDTALSYARHNYVDWVTATSRYSGRQIEAAPATIGNTRLTWIPAPSTLLQLEWGHLGSYWLEAGNSPVFGRYPGHNLYHLRARRTINRHLTAFGRVTNVLDRRFADSASVSSNTPVFTPGLPRSIHGGLEVRW